MAKRRYVLSTLLLSLIIMAIFESSQAANLRVTDSKGEVVDVNNVHIRYTKPYEKGFKVHSVLSGIEVRKGESELTVLWSNIRNIKISDGNIVKMTMRNGKEYESNLKSDYDQFIIGKNDLGEIYIDLKKVKIIEVINP